MYKAFVLRAGVCSDDINFIEYVVCPSCHSVYVFEDCIESHGRENRPKTCCHVPYPNHPHRSRRQPCGATLLKTIRIGRSNKLVPIKVFPYMPLSKSLKLLAKRPGFLAACEQWRDRQRSIPTSYLGDIYDGQIWYDFNSTVGHNFLSRPMSYLVTLNVDWFQPFSHIQYSVGAMYLTIQNLPRNIRCKQQNVILVGVIPGPSEPELAMNSYLSPLVEELKQGWEEGFTVTTYEGVQVKLRIALTCVACDIPASRKVCGFVCYRAALACNHCLKRFPVQFGEPTDYSGFDRDNWAPRTLNMYRSNCREIIKESTKTGVRKMESKYGVRYSVLLSLPYFDPIRFSAIDTMHNLYLGTGKRAFKVWVSENILTKEKLADIDRKAACFKVSAGIGRLPVNISSNYGGFKAEQWKTWITVYSPVILKDILPLNHLHCWLLFVHACNILGNRIINKSDLTTADLLLLNYCKKFEELYGKENCSMNLHLHLHLKDTILDFGPSHAFWCFPFERYNGILGSYTTNNIKVEVQFMRKFITTQAVNEISRACDPQLSSLLPRKKEVITEALTFDDDATLNILRMTTSPLSSFLYIDGKVELLPPLNRSVFPFEMLQQLKAMYQELFPSQTVTKISQFYYRCNRVKLGGDLIASV